MAELAARRPSPSRPAAAWCHALPLRQGKWPWSSATDRTSARRTLCCRLVCTAAGSTCISSTAPNSTDRDGLLKGSGTRVRFFRLQRGAGSRRSPGAASDLMQAGVRPTPSPRIPAAAARAPRHQVRLRRHAMSDLRAIFLLDRWPAAAALGAARARHVRCRAARSDWRDRGVRPAAPGGRAASRPHHARRLQDLARVADRRSGGDSRPADCAGRRLLRAARRVSGLGRVVQGVDGRPIGGEGRGPAVWPLSRGRLSVSSAAPVGLADSRGRTFDLGRLSTGRRVGAQHLHRSHDDRRAHRRPGDDRTDDDARRRRRRAGRRRDSDRRDTRDVAAMRASG